MDEKKQDPLISVIIPVYQVEPYLQRCVDSVLHQTYTNLQVILVDDGSWDRSGSICDVYQKLDNRICVLHKKNGGLADARNAGLDAARGDYIGFVDGDDFIVSDMYESLYGAISHSPAEIACCGRMDLYEKGMRERNHKTYVLREKKYYSRHEALKSLFLYESMDFSVCDKLFAAHLFEGVRFPKGRSSEDIPVVYELYNRAAGVVHAGGAKYGYCHRADSITGQQFYPQRLDYLLFIQQVHKDAVLHYPKLKREADVLLLRATVLIWRLIRQTKGDKSYAATEQKIRKMILRFLPVCVRNAYIGKEECKKLFKEVF